MKVRSLILAVSLFGLCVADAFAHRLSGHPRSLNGKISIARRQVAHDRAEGTNHWLARDRRYLRQLLALRGARRLQVAYSVPGWFWRQAMCVHSHESRDWHQRGAFRGGLQFLFGTWARAGGHGDPADASPREQVFRAYVIWRQDGGSWREWPNTSRMCGLR